MQSQVGNGATRDLNGDIAIVGIGCRFPGGANDPQTFWGLLKEGFNAVTEAPASRPGFRDLFDPIQKSPAERIRAGADFSNASICSTPSSLAFPRARQRISTPQHRLLLELAWEACEDAGIPPPALAGTATGVFIGISSHDYGDIQLYPQNRGAIGMTPAPV